MDGYIHRSGFRTLVRVACGGVAMKLRDGLQFFRWNFQHYFFAVWGLDLKFDPPYPHIRGFFPTLLDEPVFEYRTYGAHAVWAGIVAAWLPAPVLIAFIAFWAAQSFHRSGYLKNNLVFWRQVLKENGISHTRAHGRYIEQLIREIERRMKAGEPWVELAEEATQLQNDVIQHAASKEAAMRILAGK